MSGDSVSTPTGKIGRVIESPSKRMLKHRLWACQIGTDLLALEQSQERSKRRRCSGDDLVPSVDGLIAMFDWEALENFDIPE